MSIKIIFYWIIILLFARCSSDAMRTEQNNQKRLDTWIQGKYIFMDEGAGIYYEEWIKTDSITFKGSGFYLTNDEIDTLFSMKMKLLLQKDKTVMIYDVKEQNNNKEVEFVLTNKENSTYVFENPFHDFPSIMQYKILPDSSMDVTQRGFVDNKEKVRDYKVKKID
jgi:hypothetical protein